MKTIKPTENRKQKILVVDDTEATRYAISRTLIGSGFEVIEAKTGGEALQKVLSESPDLVTLDIHLPDILGFEVCRAIKANRATAQIPVLQVSASFVTSKDRIHGLEGGADSYLTHPFEPPVLIATIKALLRSRELNEELEISTERFRVALKNAPIMIYTCDRELTYTWIYNPPAPLTIDHFVGRTDTEILAPGDAEKLHALKTAAIESGTGSRVTVHINLSGSDRVFDLTIEPFWSNEGAVSGLTVACIDVTERVRAQAEQKIAFEEASLANQAKSRFLSNMSHEIRTPLGVIQGFADLALDPDVSASERNEYLQTIKRNALNLTKLLGEILDLSKIEAGRIEIEKTKFSLPTLVTEVIDALSLQANEKGVRLSFKCEGLFPDQIVSDSTRLRQILLNLINNAVKFTMRGEVAVTARMLSRSNEQEPVYVEFLVRDTGIGLTTEQQGRLFQAFTQADSSTTRQFGGTGLGLDLSKKLSHSLGGDIVLVESSIGRGSTFGFTFDAGVLTPQDFIQHQVHVQTNPRLAKFTNELLGMKVLLVEDSIDNQRLVSRYLKQAGATVDLASDGNEGVALARRGDYQVILMDIQMPNLDGLDAVAKLRADGAKTPIIALTAHALKEERERALSHGFNAYLTKPLNAALLVKTISDFQNT